MTTDATIEPITVEDLRPFCFHAIPEEKDCCLRPNLVDPFVFVYEDGWLTAASDGRILAFAAGKARWARELSGWETERDDNLLTACHLYYKRLLEWAKPVTAPTPDLPRPRYAVDRDKDPIPYTYNVPQETQFIGQPVDANLLRKIERCAGPVQWTRGWEMPISSHKPQHSSPHYYIWQGPRLSGLLCPSAAESR